MTVNGKRMAEDASYSVAANAFLASGGGGYQPFIEGTDRVDGPEDLEMLEAWFARSAMVEPPIPDRARDMTPR